MDRHLSCSAIHHRSRAKTLEVFVLGIITSQRLGTLMNLITITGKVSHLNSVASITGGGGAALETVHRTTFRVDGRHVEVEGPMSWASNDDYVAIVGVEQDGVLEPLASRNDTTGYETYAGARSYTLAVVLIFLGFFTFFITAAMGAWLIWGINKRKKLIAEATRRLHSIPRVTAAATT